MTNFPVNTSASPIPTADSSLVAPMTDMHTEVSEVPQTQGVPLPHLPSPPRNPVLKGTPASMAEDSTWVQSFLVLPQAAGLNDYTNVNATDASDSNTSSCPPSYTGAAAAAETTSENGGTVAPEPLFRFSATGGIATDASTIF